MKKKTRKLSYHYDYYYYHCYYYHYCYYYICTECNIADMLSSPSILHSRYIYIYIYLYLYIYIYIYIKCIIENVIIPMQRDTSKVNFKKRVTQSLYIVQRIKANIKQYCLNQCKRLNLLNYTLNSFLRMDDLGKAY